MSYTHKQNWNPAVSAYEAMAGGCGNTVRVWWDRSLRLWTITLVDGKGNQIGDASYAPSRELAERNAELVAERGAA